MNPLFWGFVIGVNPIGVTCKDSKYQNWVCLRFTECNGQSVTRVGQLLRRYWADRAYYERRLPGGSYRTTKLRLAPTTMTLGLLSAEQLPYTPSKKESCFNVFSAKAFSFPCWLAGFHSDTHTGTANAKTLLDPPTPHGDARFKMVRKKIRL